MSLFRRTANLSALELLAERNGLREGGSVARVTSDQAMRQSVVWAAMRLRADLVSMMPVDVFRRSPGLAVPVAVPTPRVLVEPSSTAEGHPMGIAEWLYSSQMSLDGHGNNVGIIRAFDALGLPAVIDLVNPNDVSMRIKGGKVTEYRIGGEKVDARYIWHERQHTVAGLPIGLSPIAYAALTLAGGMNAQKFATDWFANGAVPGAILKNTEAIVAPDKAAQIKDRFKASVRNGDVFVTGKDWTYDPIAAKASESSFIEQMGYSDLALCRFLGVPADMIDVPVDGSAITYASVTQRNLQLMVINLGPTVKRREDALTRLTSRPRFVKLNRAVVLAMDEKTRSEVFKLRIDSRVMTPDEARVLDDNLPLTEADYAQFERLFAARTQNPQAAKEAMP